MAETTQEGGMSTQDVDRDVTADVAQVLDHPSAGTLLPLVEDVRELEALAPADIQEAKAGYKTTEFWFAIATTVLVALGTVPTPHDAKGIVVAAVAALYAVARGLAKNGVANVESVKD